MQGAEHYQSQLAHTVATGEAGQAEVRVLGVTSARFVAPGAGGGSAEMTVSSSLGFALITGAGDPEVNGGSAAAPWNSRPMPTTANTRTASTRAMPQRDRKTRLRASSSDRAMRHFASERTRGGAGSRVVSPVSGR